MFGEAKKTLRRIINKKENPIDLENVSDDEIRQWTYTIEARPIRFFLKPEQLRLQGGWVFDASNPLVAAISQGDPVLERFYKQFAPKNLLEMYGLDEQHQDASQSPPWEIPWAMRKYRTAPGGEKGLAASEGVAFYGPASDAKIQLESARLKQIVALIQQNGYQPEKHGNISGQFLDTGDKLAFYVRGGKHRTAALCHLNFERIPVVIKPMWHNRVHLNDVKNWPLCANGTLSEETSRAILQAFVKGKRFV